MGEMANEGEDTQSQVGNEEGEGTPVFEVQTNEITIYETRLRKYCGSPSIAFILGHPVYGVLGSVDGLGREPGSNTLGFGAGTITLCQVTNFQDAWEEEFNNVRFQNISSTIASWNTDLRRLVF